MLRENRSLVLCCIFVLFTTSNGITNTNFNASIRDYSNNADFNNLTDIKTLQKEDTANQANFSPIHNSEPIKEIPDNVQSSSSLSRGLIHHELPEYVISDYDDTPHYGHGHDYHAYDDHYKPHTYKHHYDYHDPGHHYYAGHHHLDYGHHYKHHGHDLAAKTLLWPIAGIALLGAAAALVTNPVLLQLGVVSGRRKRDTEVTSEFKPNIEKWTNSYSNNVTSEVPKEDAKKNTMKRDTLKVQHALRRNKHIKTSNRNIKIIRNTKVESDNRFIPIPLILKNN